MSDKEIDRMIQEHKRAMAAERRQIMRQLQAMGYRPKSPEDAVRLARRLTLKQ